MNNFWASDDITFTNQKHNKKAEINRLKTIGLIDSIGGLHGNVLDIGSRNFFTEILEKKYKIGIDSTSCDLDECLTSPKTNYNFVHYNNVIEHQFNPLFTLLEIKKILDSDGILILGCPLKPKWITSAKCHFHEFDEYTYQELIKRAGFKEVKRIHFYKQFSINGIRGIFGSFFNRQVVVILMPN
jgi:hypothetical protein